MIPYLNRQWYSFMEMRQALGDRLCVFIMLSQHMMKGAVFGGGTGGVVGIPILFLFKSYRSISLDAVQIQIYKNIALTPWALKSIIGIVSDTVSILGFHKLPYIYASLTLAIISCIVLASAWPVGPIYAVGLLLMINLACAVTDLLVEARYSECINKEASQGPNITSFVWTGIAVGSMLSTVPIGLLLEYGVEPHWLYYIPILPMITVLYFVCRNWLGDTLQVTRMVETEEGPRLLPVDTVNCCGPFFWFSLITRPDPPHVCTATGETLSDSSVSSEEEEEEPKTPVIAVKWQTVKREWRAVLLSFGIVFLSLLTSFLGVMQVHPYYLCGVSLVGSVAMILGFNLLIGGVTAQIQTYVLIQSMFSMSISSAEFFFMTDTVEQFPEGPHFSKSFYVIAMGLTGSFCSVLGTVSYSFFMANWRYRTVFYFSNIVSVLLGLLNIAFVLHWNRLIGVPDSIFVIGSEVIQVVIGTWTNMPLIVAIASLCPKDMEAIMYALLAGSSNLGGSLSHYTGASLLTYLGINPSGAIAESHQFTNLWKAVTIVTLLPLLTIVTVPFLIPDTSQKESLLIQDNPEMVAYVDERRFIDDDDET